MFIQISYLRYRFSRYQILELFFQILDVLFFQISNIILYKMFHIHPIYNPNHAPVMLLCACA